MLIIYRAIAVSWQCKMQQGHNLLIWSDGWMGYTNTAKLKIITI